MVTTDRTHHHIKKSINWILIIIVALFAAFLLQVFRLPASKLAKAVANPATKEITLRLRNIKLEAELARTETERARGLSNRASLGEFKAMLFVFPEPTIPRFWMRDTNFPLDIIWIDEKLKIIGIEHNLSPDSFPNTVSPARKVPYVLEVNGGLTNDYNIQVGDTLGL